MIITYLLPQTWADAFRGVHELKEVDKVYNDLKSKGIEFPMTDLDSLAPIHTPARVSSQSDAPTHNDNATRFQGQGHREFSRL